MGLLYLYLPFVIFLSHDIWFIMPDLVLHYKPIIIIIIIIIFVITFMHGIYNYIPVYRVYSVAAVLYLQFVLHVMPLADKKLGN
jgi:hypothetical protein